MNEAEALEQAGVPGAVNISHAFLRLLTSSHPSCHHNFSFSHSAPASLYTFSTSAADSADVNASPATTAAPRDVSDELRRWTEVPPRVASAATRGSGGRGGLALGRHRWRGAGALMYPAAPM